MNCNMTSKKLSKIFMIFLILSLFLVGKTIVRAQDEIYKDADILLIYNDNPNMEEKLSIQKLVTNLTYQQHSVTFVPVSQATYILDRFENIISYQLDSVSESFIEELVKVDKELMIVGGNFIDKYVQMKKIPLEVQFTEANFAETKYSFYYDEFYSSLIEVTEPVFLLKGNMDYENGKLIFDNEESKFIMRKGRLTYIPVLEMSDSVGEGALIFEITRWMWPYNGEPHTFAQYMILDEVYPFIEPKQLLESVQLFIDRGDPFVICVMPIYQNQKFPDFKKFCEILRYAQDNGGTIILHNPITQSEKYNLRDVQEHLNDSIGIYTSYGVYPVGIKAPETWMYDSKGLEILKRFSTVFWYEEEIENPNINLNENYNSIYLNGHKSIAPVIDLDNSGISHIKYYSTGVYMDINIGIEKLRTMMLACNNFSCASQSLWKTDHSLFTDNMVITTEESKVFVNGVETSLLFEPFTYEEEYDYQRSFVKKLVVNMKNQNKVFRVITIVAVIIFICLIIYGRKIMEDKFFYRK